MTEHLTFDQLCDLQDGVLDGDIATAATDHLAACAACSTQVASLGRLATETRALPSTIAPPEDLWADVQANIVSSRQARRPAIRGWSGWQLAAAAVIIAVSSAALTLTTVTFRGKATLTPTSAVVTSAAPRAVVALPAALASQESEFTRSADELQHTLDDHRAALAPSTVETVERSLRVADSAIAEARDALARDPANRALAKLFASNYERKIDLLKRATELAPRT